MRVTCRSMLSRTLIAGSLAAILAGTGLWAELSAQVVGRNVNMVSGVTWPDGDPFLQRQNEPSLAASTRNPQHLLAGSNDYRSVDLPGLPGGEETGDAWLGLFKSLDAGGRWTSNLLPGYPQDHSPDGLVSPIKGYQAAADPVVRAGSHGVFYYAGLAFDRTTTGTASGKSAIFVARYVDNNNLEAGDPIKYAGTSVVDSVPAGDVFLDKPWMAVDVPREGAVTCRMTTQSADGPTTQAFPGGVVYVAYTKKSTDTTGERWDLFLARSIDCGLTYSAPVRVSRAEDRVNQGATIAISPVDGKVFVAWRRIDLTGDEDAIMVARSRDRGRSFDPPGVARRFPRGLKKGLDPWKFSQRKKPMVGQADEVADVSPFDQGTSASALSFRTNAYPTMALDATGRIHLAWSERGYAVNPARADPAAGDARILIVTSADGDTWTPPMVVADRGQAGHQIMPALTIAGDRLLLAYYDLQEDRSGVVDTKFVDDQTAFARTAPDRRHTIDLRTAMARPGVTPEFAPSMRVSGYLRGFVTGVPVQRDGEGKAIPSQLQANPPNLPMFKLGTVPFLGDYIDVAPAPAFVPDAAGNWRHNTGTGSIPPAFHVVWTDNRDVRAPFDGDWTKYTPPTYAGPRPDPDTAVACVPGRAGARNQNIYTATVTEGLRVGSPGNTKPLSLDLQRAFVVYAENTTASEKVFRFTIVSQPPGGRASFAQFPLPPYSPTSPVPLTVIDVTTPRYTTASRTVYVTSTDVDAAVTIDVSEIAAAGAPGPLPGGLVGTVVLNPDISNPEVDNPEVDNPEVDNTDILQAEIQNPEVDNPEVDNPEVDNPEVDNPEVDNPEVDNIVIANPEVDNPEVDNPEVDNPEVDNPEVDNPEVDNYTLLTGGGTITDITWTISNVGNTTTAYNLNVYLNGTTVPPEVDLQLLIYRRYRTPAIGYNSCDLRTVTQNVLVANIVGPDLLVDGEGPLGANDADASNATLWLAPGEEAQVTLRVFDPDTSNNVIVNGASIDPAVIPEQDVSLVSRAQPVSTPLAEGGVTEPVPVAADPFPSFTVTTTADSGPGSLRAAIAGANLQSGLDSVLFAIPGAGPHTISLLSPLPALTGPTVIDGASQPGYAGTPLVELEGTSAGAGAIGLALQGGASTVRALAVNRFTTGIDMSVAGGNAVVASRIGTDPAGVVALPNTTGIRADFSSPSSNIGGAGAGEGNVISGNTGNGVLLLSGGHRVVGNRIGTDVTGTVDLGNAVYGIDTGVGANVIGEVGAGNLISGNDSFGAIIRGTGNLVQANRIGTDAAGLVALPNGNGLGVWDAEGAIIGGSLPGEGNLISGNGFGLGLAFSTGTTQPAIVQGNLIGTAANGVDPIPNFANVFGAGTARAVVGGTVAGQANTIAFGVFGAWVQDAASITLRGNSMFGFGFRAIDLNVDGPTLNDPLDADVGPNQLQNYPGVTGVTPTSVGGELFSAAGGSYTIDFYVSATATDARTWIASVSVTADAAGYALIPAQAVSLASGQFVTATATDAAGNTSELAPAVIVP